MSHKLPDYFEFSLPTKVVYSPGITKNLQEVVASFGKRRALLVTDQVLLEAGPVDQVQAGLQDSDIEITATFSNVPPNSTIKAVESCVRVAKRGKCDLVLAIGGGSVLDTAKVANLLITKGGKLQDHMGAYLLGNDSLLPMIFIPTTAGTGSEVTKVAMIADLENDVKLPFTENQFLPEMAILDPELTTSMPAKLTAMTGMDALTHAIEAYVGKDASPASDALALHVIKLIHQNLLIACANPNNLEARGAMLVASCLAGVAFSHSMVGMVHSIAHALGGIYHIPHGLANLLVLPEVMEYNLASAEERYCEIAGALGVNFPQLVSEGESMLQFCKIPKVAKKLEKFRFIDNWVRRQAAKAGIAEIRRMNRQLAYLTQIPLNLRDAGIQDELEHMEQLIETALSDGSMLYNPREPEGEAVRKIVTKLYQDEVKPLAVNVQDWMHTSAQASQSKQDRFFDSSQELYEVLVPFYEELRADSDMRHALSQSKLCVQFVYQNPDGVITLNAKAEEPQIIVGEFDGTPDVTFQMNADIAHVFWHGKVNLLSAITRRQIVAKGNVPQAVKLLPILKPAFNKYPQFLHQHGYGELALS